MKVGLRSLAPLQISGLRIVSGAAVLVALLAASRGRLPRDRTVWAHLLVSAFFLCTLPFSLFALGEQRVSSALAGIGNATTPHRRRWSSACCSCAVTSSAGARSSACSWGSSGSW